MVAACLLGCTADRVSPESDTGASANEGTDRTETRSAKIARCMQAEGWDVTYYPSDDSYGGETSTDQADQYDASAVECGERFPVTGPSSFEEYSQADWDQLYKGEVARAACLRAEGVEIPGAPSKTVFIEEYPSGDGWYAYSFVSPSEVGRDTWEDLNQACPQS